MFLFLLIYFFTLNSVWPTLILQSLFKEGGNLNVASDEVPQLVTDMSAIVLHPEQDITSENEMDDSSDLELTPSILPGRHETNVVRIVPFKYDPANLLDFRTVP